MNETIAAISTCVGESGIGIVRISGERAKAVLADIFTWNRGELEEFCDRHMYYGFIEDGGKIVDEVLAVYMKAPNTYTGEDVVEINCHGSMLALRKILELILKKGVRAAEKGEFSKRAFLNGRMDLSQAEAVIDLIQAKTDLGYGIAVDQLTGKFSDEIRGFRNVAMEILSEIIVDVDYPDADKPEVTFENLRGNVGELRDGIRKLLDTYDTGKIIRDGFNVVIIGKPNVGKSSLMNALLKEHRAIVTEIAGTTRDSIEEVVNIGGIPVKLVDTAGIRKTDDKIELLGIERSKRAFDTADLILLMFDNSRPLDEEEKKMLKLAEGKPTIVCINKVDLEDRLNLKGLRLSLKSGEGVEALEKEIERCIYKGDVKKSDTTLITNIRHAESLKAAVAELDEALVMVDKREALDFIEMNIRRAVDQLGEITGDTANENILDEVFSRFCLGK